jgi:palmitoyltransferase
VIFTIASGLYLLGLFEFFVVPLLELLPQENIVFITLIFISIIFFYKVSLTQTFSEFIQQFFSFKTYQRSSLNRLGHTEPMKPDDQVTLLVDEKLPESDDESEAGDRNSCGSCRKYIPARTYHCNVCKGCVIARDHHNFFLNCCVGRFNHKYFFAGCVACCSAFVLFANLSLTSICHPFPIFMVFSVNILLPDDCSGVFTETEYVN